MCQLATKTIPFFPLRLSNHRVEKRGINIVILHDVFIQFVVDVVVAVAVCADHVF